MVYQLPVTLNWTNRQKNIDGIEIWNQQLYVLQVKCAKAIPFPSHILDGVKMQSASGSTYMDNNIPKLYLTKYCSPALLLMSEGLNYWYHQTVLPLFLVAQKEIRKDLVWDVTSEWVLILGRLSCEFFFFLSANMRVKSPLGAVRVFEEMFHYSLGSSRIFLW